MATNTYSTRKLAVTVTKKSQARMPSAWLRTNVILLLSIDSTAHWLRPINLLAKRAGERSAGNLHAPFDVAGDGNQLTVRFVRHSQGKRGATDRSNLRSQAPFLDPTRRTRRNVRRNPV